MVWILNPGQISYICGLSSIHSWDAQYGTDDHAIIHMSYEYHALTMAHTHMYKYINKHINK